MKNTGIFKLIEGIKYWFKGFAFVLKNFKLWKYLLLPLIINFIIIIIIFSLGWNFVSQKLPDAVFVSPADKKGLLFLLSYFKAAGIYIGQMFVQIISFIISFVIFLLLYIYSSIILGSPFYDYLSFKIEKLYGLNVQNTPFSVSNNVLYPLVSSVKMSMFGLIVMIMAFPLNWIPLIGNIGYIILISFPLALNLIAYSTERRLWKFREVLKFGWENKYSLTGFGLMAFISMLPFGLNLITFPLSVAGGAILFIEKYKTEKKPADNITR